MKGAEGSTFKPAGDALPIGSDFPHIEVTTPETVLLMSTVYGESSTRNHFIPVLAGYIGKPDGKTSLHHMFTMAIAECQKNHRQKNKSHIQKPLYISSAKRIILPQPE